MVEISVFGILLLFESLMNQEIEAVCLNVAPLQSPETAVREGPIPVAPLGQMYPEAALPFRNSDPTAAMVPRLFPRVPPCS
jgi:hypothetical protein